MFLDYSIGNHDCVYYNDLCRKMYIRRKNIGM